MWNTLQKPFFALAPMADVTDQAFRQMFAKYGKPDLLWTEFVSADGLFSPGRDILMEDLKFKENEHKIIGQFFSSSKENIKQSAELALDLGFDGFDINMGCPDRSIEKQGCGASLLKNLDLAVDLINSACEVQIPVSVKTRIGYSSVSELDGIARRLFGTGVSAVTFHLRTRKELSSVPAHWELMEKIVSIRDKLGVDTLIIGNGDVSSMEEGYKLVEKYGFDGVMIGRAAFGAPWFFSGSVPPLKKRLEIAIEHSFLFEELLPHKSFNIMKKHFKAYINDFRGAKELRVKCMEADSASEVSNIIKAWIDTNL